MLWTLVLISLLVSTIAAVGGGRARQAGDLRRNAELRAEAWGGIQEAGFHLLDASRAHWPADGSEHRVRHGAVLLSLRMVSEAGKVNPNRASIDLLASLLQAVGADGRVAPGLAASIVAWRFNGGTPAVPEAGRDYTPPGAPFESIDELGLVSGMTPRLLARLAPHLTLYHDNDPDLSLADPVVLQAVQALSGPGAIAAAATSAKPDETTVAVTAVATDPSGHRAVRRAVLTTSNEGSGGQPFQIVSDAPGT